MFQRCDWVSNTPASARPSTIPQSLSRCPFLAFLDAARAKGTITGTNTRTQLPRIPLSAIPLIPFAFYNPSTWPSATRFGRNYDPTGNNTQGRVTVVFGGNWAKAAPMCRIGTAGGWGSSPSACDGRAPGNIDARSLIATDPVTAIARESNRYSVVVTERLPRLQLTDSDMFVLNPKNGGCSAHHRRHASKFLASHRIWH